MSTRAYIIHEDKKISFDPDEAIPEGDACDHCGNMIPFTSGDVMTGKFRIGSKGKHEFTVHRACAAGMLENICREELHFLSAGTQCGSMPLTATAEDRGLHCLKWTAPGIRGCWRRSLITVTTGLSAVRSALTQRRPGSGGLNFLFKVYAHSRKDAERVGTQLFAEVTAVP